MTRPAPATNRLLAMAQRPCVEGPRKPKCFLVRCRLGVPPCQRKGSHKMRKTLVSLGTAAALLLSSTAVRADPVVSFDYSASAAVNPNALPGDDPSILYNTNSALKTSSIKFTPAQGTA